MLPESSPKQSWLGPQEGAGDELDRAQQERQDYVQEGDTRGDTRRKGEKSLAWDRTGRAEPTEPKGTAGAGHVGSRNEHGRRTPRGAPCPEGPLKTGWAAVEEQAAAGRHRA